MKICDLHTHILPHMDHGCGRTATAVAQLELLQKNGVEIVAATSHFYPQNTLPDAFLQERKESVDNLLTAYGNRPRPHILLGAEVLICPGLENMEGLRDLCYRGTNLMLLEMPFTRNGWGRELYHTIHEIQRQGIRPILAHVDRYPAPLIDELFSDMNLIGQVNADSLTRMIKPKQILNWIDEGRIVALGSDLHGQEAKAHAPFVKVVNNMKERASVIMEEAESLFHRAELI